MTGLWVFGYGSLVNLDTHSYETHYPARLTGWTRSWRHWIDTPNRKAVSLTVEPSDGTRIEGRVAFVPDAALPALDQREAGYDRISLPPDALDIDGPTVPVVMYRSRSCQPGGATHPIIQSYVDCVLAGFEALGGAVAIERFISSTDGWETPILRDRATPLYPRAVTLASQDAARFDGYLDAIGVKWLDR